MASSIENIYNFAPNYFKELEKKNDMYFLLKIYIKYFIDFYSQ
jgi:hypothetical protein